MLPSVHKACRYYCCPKHVVYVSKTGVKVDTKASYTVWNKKRKASVYQMQTCAVPTKLKWNNKDRHKQKQNNNLQHKIGPFHINFDSQNRKQKYILITYSHHKLFKSSNHQFPNIWTERQKEKKKMAAKGNHLWHRGRGHKHAISWETPEVYDPSVLGQRSSTVTVDRQWRHYRLKCSAAPSVQTLAGGWAAPRPLCPQRLRRAVTTGPVQFLAAITTDNATLPMATAVAPNSHFQLRACRRTHMESRCGVVGCLFIRK